LWQIAVDAVLDCARDHLRNFTAMASFMSDSVLIFFGAILLFVVLKLLSGKNNTAGQPYKYVLNKTLFTPAERSFLGVLDLAIADR
jgi:hypothetical protein